MSSPPHLLDHKEAASAKQNTAFVSRTQPVLQKPSHNENNGSELPRRVSLNPMHFAREDNACGATTAESFSS